MTDRVDSQEAQDVVRFVEVQGVMYRRGQAFYRYDGGRRGPVVGYELIRVEG